MEFIKVFNAFNEGKKIRRNSWHPRSFISIQDNRKFSVEELNATDWEIYKEPKPLPRSRKEISDPIYVDIEISNDCEGRSYRHVKYLTMSASWINPTRHQTCTYDPQDVTELGHLWLEQHGIKFDGPYTCINILSPEKRKKLIDDIREIM